MGVRNKNLQLGASVINAKDEIFGKYTDETGEEYYCPIMSVSDGHVVCDWELDNCVEASTAQRYSGNLKIVRSQRVLGR